jgi:hypothetical protein
MTLEATAIGLMLSLLAPLSAPPLDVAAAPVLGVSPVVMSHKVTSPSVLSHRGLSRWILAQAMIPPTGMDDAAKPMPMADRMQRRFPQPVRIGDLIGLPVLDDSASTLGFVRQVVRTPDNKVELIVSYSRWFGWFGRPVAVPIEVLGIEGRQLVSLDMPRSDYAAAATWRRDDATVLPDDATIRVALARN